MLLDTIGIASICALLVVSSVPEILADAHRLAPTLIGFLVLGGAFWKTRSIIIPVSYTHLLPNNWNRTARPLSSVQPCL